MKVDIKTINKVNGLLIDKKLPASWIKEYFEAEDPILASFNTDIDIRLNLFFTSTDQLICNGGWNTLLHFSCDRCLEEFDYEFKNDFTILFLPKGTPDFDEDSATDCFFYAEEEIDFLTVFGELMSLNLPFAKICKSDCKGICQVCGKNNNLEKCSCADNIKSSKFEALRNFK